MGIMQNELINSHGAPLETASSEKREAVKLTWFEYWIIFWTYPSISKFLNGKSGTKMEKKSNIYWNYPHPGKLKSSLALEHLVYVPECFTF
jgi:hypothetical protein